MENTSETNKITTIKAWLKTGSLNLFGLPFAGKDTHAAELAQLLDGVVIGGGDILRNTTTPAHIREHVGTGALAPTEEFLTIVLPYFSQETFRNKPLILSSVGRWHGEEAGVLEATAESGHPLLLVIYIKITPEELRKRHGVSDRGGRKDDAEHILQTRIDEFTIKTLPVIDFYRSQGMLLEIDGIGSQAQVRQRIIDALFQHAQAMTNI